MKYIALDIGSSYLKSALIDLQRLSIQIQRERPMARADKGPDNLCHEINAEYIFQTAKAMVDEYLEHNKDIAGILISTQMHGFVFCGADGMAKSPYVSWQDNRCLRDSGGGRSYLDKLIDMIPRRQMLSHGLYMKPGLGLCNAYTAVEQGSFDLRDGDMLCALGAYLIFRFTGEKKCHITNAAPLGLVDIQAERWNEGLIKRLGFDRFNFFDMVNETQVCGFYRGSVPVYPDWGDQQMAVLGSLMKSNAEVNINVATASQLTYIDTKFTIGTYETRPYFEDMYLNTITRMPNGRGMDLIIDFVEEIGESIFKARLTREEIWERVLREVDHTTLELMSCDVGFFKDLLGTEQGAFGNITNENFTIGNMMKSLCTAYANVYDKYLYELVKDRGKIERIIYAGGALLKNPYLQKVIEEKTKIKGVVAPINSEVFLGHLRLALVCSKTSRDLTDALTLIRPGLELKCVVMGSE